MIVPFHSFLYLRAEQSPRGVLLKIFFETSQNSQGNSCTGLSFLIKLQVSACEFCGISENAFSYRIASMTASERLIWFSDKGLREREREREREGGREGGREREGERETFYIYCKYINDTYISHLGFANWGWCSVVTNNQGQYVTASVTVKWIYS